MPGAARQRLHSPEDPSGNFLNAARNTSLADLLTVVFKRRWSAATIVAATMFGVVFWMLFIREDTYDTTAQVLVRIGHEQASSNAVAHPSVMITGDRVQDVNSESEILHSADLLDAIITEFKLDQPQPPKPVPEKLLPRIKYEVKQVVQSVKLWKDNLMIGFGLKEALSPREQALANFQKALVVTPERNSNILTVHLFVEQREYGAPILNKLLDMYQTFRLRIYQERGTAEFFRGEVNQNERDLRGAEEQLRQFENKWNISAIQKQKEVLLEQIASNRTAVNEEAITIRDLTAKLARAEQEAKKPDPDIAAIGSFAGNSFPEALLHQLAGLQAERQKLRMTELDSGPRITNNREQFRVALRMVQAHLSSALADKQASHDRRAQVLTDLENEVRSLQDKEGTWNDLKRRVKVFEDAYLDYQKRLEESSAKAVMQQQSIGNVSIIQHAVQPTQGTGISKMRLLGLALLLSIFAAAAWLGVAEFLDDRIYTADQLEARTGVPVIEVIPRIRGLRRKGKRGIFEVPGVYRRAAWALANMVRPGQIVAACFTSTERGEGTTTAVLAVAEHLHKRHGLRTLVVELDRDHPQLVHAFDLDSDKTVDAYSAGKTPALQVVQKNGSGVSYVPVASAKDDGGPILPSHVRNLIADLRSEFDVVLLDGPPLSEPDAIAAITGAGLAIMVVEAGRTRNDLVERARREIAAEGVPVLGALLNKQRQYIPRWIARWV